MGFVVVVVVYGLVGQDRNMGVHSEPKLHLDIRATPTTVTSSSCYCCCSCVRLLGQDRSVGVRSEPKLHLDLIAMPNETSFVNLSTPPRTLTLDDRPFPGIDDDRNTMNNRHR